MKYSYGYCLYCFIPTVPSKQLRCGNYRDMKHFPRVCLGIIKDEIALTETNNNYECNQASMDHVGIG